MDLSFLSEWATFSLGPSGYAILLALIVVLSFPVLLHLFLYSQQTSSSLPTFLLAGPSGAGKTTLLTLLERGTPARTHISQTPLSVECTLPSSTDAASNQDHSAHDASTENQPKFILVDTPGHGKLRHHAMSNLVNPQNLKGILFVVDAATLSTGVGADDAAGSSLAEAAEYLHDLLLALQKRHAKSKDNKEMPVLVAANKLDLFTALPAKLVKSSLEGEISRLRGTKAKGLLDSGVGMEEAEPEEEERAVLGGGGEGKFEFGLMEEYGVSVEVLGGSAMDAGGAATDVSRWLEWIGRHL